MPQVRKFAHFCLEETGHFQPCEPGNDRIGTLSISRSGQLNWTAWINELSIKFASKHFTGEIAYCDIIDCRSAALVERNGQFEQIDLASMYLSLGRDAIVEMKRMENGIIIHHSRGQAPILTAVPQDATSLRTTHSLDRFLYKVRKTKAWTY